MTRIENLPRPWLLAAIAGVPMSALLGEDDRPRPAITPLKLPLRSWPDLRLETNPRRTPGRFERPEAPV